MRFTSESPWRTNILLALGSLLVVIVVLFAAEGSLRLFSSDRPAFQVYNEFDRATHFHPELGWYNDPNNEELETDDIGLRVSVHEGATKNADRRILFLGDSTTFGIGVSSQDTFVSQLNRNVQEITFFNGGVTGYGTVQEYLLFDELFELIQPTHVVLVMFANDLKDNTFHHQGYPRPLGSIGDDGALHVVQIDPPVPWWRISLYKMSKKSHLYNLVVRTGESKTEHRQRILNTQVASHMPDEWGIVTQTLLALRQSAEQKGVSLTVLLHPTRTQYWTDLFITDPEDRQRNEFEQAAWYLQEEEDVYALEWATLTPFVGVPYAQLQPPVKDPRYARLVAYGADHDLVIIDLTWLFWDEALIQMDASQVKNLYLDSAHLTQEGHQIMADVLENLIEKGELVPYVEASLRPPDPS